MSNTRRLRSLMADLEAQGVRFQRDGDQVTVSGMTTDAWLRDWLERHRRDLLAILGKPESDDLRVEEMAA